MPSAPATVRPLPLVIANPAAGRGRTGRELGHLLTAVRAAVGPSTSPRPPRPEMHRGSRPPPPAMRRPLVISIGGDGTFSEVADGLMRAATAGTDVPPGGVPLWRRRAPVRRLHRDRHRRRLRPHARDRAVGGRTTSPSWRPAPNAASMSGTPASRRGRAAARALVGQRALRRRRRSGGPLLRVGPGVPRRTRRLRAGHAARHRDVPACAAALPRRPARRRDGRTRRRHARRGDLQRDARSVEA